MIPRIVLIPILFIAPVIGSAVYLWGASESPIGIQDSDVIVAVALGVVLFFASWTGYKIAVKRLMSQSQKRKP